MKSTTQSEWTIFVARSSDKKRIFIGLLFFFIFGTGVYSQTPTITVRFANPEYNCETQTYCLDVEFNSNMPDQQLFGINVRFFFDHSVLEFISFSDYQGGYGPAQPNPPFVDTGNPASGPALFNFTGAATFVNGAVQLINPTGAPIIISTTGWTKLFRMCFNIQDPDALGSDSFCPSLVWDMEEDPDNGGFLVGSDGVVISVVAPSFLASTPVFAGVNPNIAATPLFTNGVISDMSAPAFENVVQFNWEYSGNPDETPWGSPVEEICIDTSCEIELIVTKTAAEDDFNAMGDIINYTIVVSNTGDLTISDIDVVDDLTGDNWFIASLSPGESESFITTYSITQDDLDAGSVFNTVTVSGQDPDGEQVQGNAQEEVHAVQLPELAISKTADQQTYDTVGQLITYTIQVENTGNVSISGIDVMDDLTGDAWVIPNLTPGESESFTAFYTITNADINTGNVLNVALVTGTDPEGNQLQSTDSENITAMVTDLSIVKTQIDGTLLPIVQIIAPSEIIAGDKIFYQLLVTNHGPTNAENVVITDNLPANIFNTEYSLNNGNSWQSWDGTRILPTFTFPGVNNIIIKGDLDPGATGTITNTASVTSDTTDPNPENNTDELVTAISAEADLSITKSVTSGSVVIGDPIEYTITVFNNGPSNAHDVVITDIFDPVNITEVEYLDNGQWINWTGSTDIGTLLHNETFTLQLRGMVEDTASDPLPNTATVTSSTQDPNPDNNSYTINTPVGFLADLSIVKTGPATAVAGETITYSLTAANNGPGFASNVIISDNIPAMISDAEYSLDNGTTWEPWTGSINIVLLDEGENIALLLQGVLLPDASGIINNTATIDSDVPDPDISNNSSTAVTSITRIADLEITKIQIDPSTFPVDPLDLPDDVYDLAIDPAQIQNGEAIYYLIVYQNNGPSEATNVIITDIVPSEVMNPEASRCQAAFLPWAGSFNTGTVPAGGRCIIVIRGTISSTATGMLTNTVSVNSDDITDPNPDNNESSFTTEIIGQPELIITKTLTSINGDAGITTFDSIGDEILYTIIMENTGNVTITDIDVVDDLTGDAWFIASLTPGDSETFTATYVITQDDLDAGSVLNTVVATGMDPNGEDVEADDDETITADPDALNPELTVSKTAAENSYNATGDVINYTILIENTGNVTITDIDIEDDLTGDAWYIPTLLPGESETFTTSYTITQDDIDDGSVLNTVVVTGEGLQGQVLFATSNALVESVQCPQLLSINNIGPLCPGAEVPLILLGTDPADINVEYQWYGGEDVGLEDGTATGINPHIPAFFASDNFDSSTVTVIATLNGCISSTTFTIVIDDIEPPVFENCIDGQVITISLFPGDCEGGVNWSIPYATDNCGEVTVTQTAGPTPGSILPVGTYPIEYTATDAAGNSTTCAFTLEVIDTEGPVIVCPGNMVISNNDPGECHWTSPPGSLTPLLATANCAFDVFWEAENPDGSLANGTDDISGYVFNQGITTITYTITEVASQQSWSCSFTVTVLDSEPPALICPPAIVQNTDQGTCAATLTPELTPADVVDNCTDFDDLIITYRVFNPDNSLSEYLLMGTAYDFEAGISQIEWMVEDLAGNTANCLQQVVIEPIIPVADAGADDVICAGESYQLTGAASDYDSVLWTTSGTGSFVPDPHSLDAVYVPGSADISIGQVQLTLTAFGFGNCPDADDMMILDILPQPLANAGPDAEICENETYQVTEASAENFEQILWTHNGLGTLENEETLFPTYISHPDDVIAGTVILTLTVESSGICPDAVDQMTLFVKPIVYADAGEDQILVDEFSTTLNGNDPSPATGMWSQISGPNFPIIEDPNDPQSTVSGLTFGTYILRWTIQNAPCPDDFDDMTIYVTGADEPVLTILKSVDPEEYVSPGTTLSYTLLVQNTANTGLTNITINDELPEYTSFISASQGGAYDENLNMVTWSVTLLEPDEYISLELNVMIDDDTPNGWVIENTAIADSDQTDPLESNPAEVTVIRDIELHIVSVDHVLCHGEHTGIATVEATGGLPPYSFIWFTDPVRTGATAYQLPAGTYVVMATDALGNTAQTSVTITQPDAPLDAMTLVSNVSCNGEASGSILVDVYDGTPPYTFLWSNGDTSQNLENVYAGIYTLQITDANGCKITIQEEIKEPPMLLVIDVMIEDVVCREDSLGSIDFVVTGGVPPYEYLWNNGRTTPRLKNMPGGFYEVTITDANNCVHVYEFEIGYQHEDCEIKVPEGISMNQSGFNDIWIINGLIRYPDNKVQVFNRWGTLVYEAQPYENDWDGTPNRGRILTESDGKLPAGTYYWIIKLNPNLEPLSGFIYLGR